MADAHFARSGARRVTHFAWGTLVYTGLVILFGALVRITGSGAGCGQHWPTCKGEIAHLPTSLETAIELGHRVTSGLSFLVVVALVVAVRRVVDRSHVARRAARAALAFMIVEVVVGALLVLLSLVGSDDSVARAAVMGMHLVNTFLLMAALALVARFIERPSIRLLDRPAAGWFLLVALALLFVSMTGAVTALGDTVRPTTLESTLAQRFGDGYSTTAHFLDRLRGLHPAVAAAAAVLLVIASARLMEQFGAGTSGTLLRAALALTILQTAVGTLNIWLAAPGWLQLVHLGLALTIWVVWILSWAAAPATADWAPGPGLPEGPPPATPQGSR